MSHKRKIGRVEEVSEDTFRLWPTPREKYKPDGSRNRPNATFHGTYADAQIELGRLYLAEHGPDESTTYGEFWAATVDPSIESLAAKTKREYRRLWRRELSPRISHLEMAGTDHEMVQSVIDKIEAPTVQRSTMRLWKKILNMPGASRVVPRNPVDRHIKVKPHRKREKRDIDAEEVIPYLRSLAGTRYQLPCTLMICCGLCLEEAAALLGTDVRERIYRGRRYAIVDVRRALVTAGAKVLKETKNEFRERFVWLAEPFASFVLAMLGDGPILPSRKYDPGREMDESWFVNPSTLRNNWFDWCERNDVDYVRLGDMRTIYSDRQAEADSPDSLVGPSMGHSDGTTRGRNYKRPTARGMAMIADNLAALLTEECPCLPLIEGGWHEIDTGGNE